MRRDLRPHSAKCRPNFNKLQGLPDDFNSKQQNDLKLKTQQLPSRPPSANLYVQQSAQTPPSQRMSSSSKLLKKFETIRAYRQTKQDELNVQELLIIQKTKIEEKEKGSRKISEELKANKFQYPELRPTSAFNQPISKKNRLQKQRSPRPQSAIQSVELPKISVEDLIFQKQQTEDNIPSSYRFNVNNSQQPKSGVNEGKNKNLDNTRTAYWRSQNKFVSLFPLQKNQNLNYQHDHILPIYAEVIIKQQRYVVSDEYKNCSLRHLIEEFTIFPQQLVKRYLKQICLGVQHLHFHKKSHNQLNSRTILYNKHGNLFINMLKAAAIYRNKQDLTNLFWHSPESLSPKMTRSFKNDIWAIGCLAIQMLTKKQLTSSPLHPYNFNKYRNNREQTMIDNIRQRYPGLLQGNKNGAWREEENRLSQAAISFVSSCLQILQQKRPEMCNLLEHQFFQGS